jgi:glucose-1-phosphate thymidylyltransferase
MIEKGEKFKTFKVEGWYDCGKPETLLETNRILLNKIKDKNTKIDNVIVIQPSYISPKAYVNRAIIGPFVTISEGCRVVDSIIKNSILSPNAIVENSLLDNSIIGNNAIIKGNYKKLNAGDSSEIEFY